MNKTNLVHAISAVVKGLSVVMGLSAYAHLVPGEYGIIAVAAFAIVSALKDFLTAAEKAIDPKSK
jgi:hypothetical protein